MAIKSGHLQQLENLELNSCSPVFVELAAIVKAMEETGGSRGLRRLRLVSLYPTRQQGEALGGAIRAKAFPNLEVLSLTGDMPADGPHLLRSQDVRSEGLVAIMEGLEDGGCTRLKHINLKFSNLSVDVATAFGRVLSSGHCHNLQTLICAGAFPDKSSLLAFLQSINGLTFPAMQSLDISTASMDEECSILFGEMVKAGAFSKLKRLGLSDQQIHRGVWEALEIWSCPELKELVLQSAELSSDSAAGLVSALTSGALSKVQWIDLQGTRVGDSGDGGDASGGSSSPVVNVLNAVASSCPDLRYLGASFIINTCEQAGTAIFEALREGKWSKLEDLEIGSPDLPDEWGLPLAGILEGGAGGTLRSLTMYEGSDETVRELGRVLHEGACPKMRSLAVDVRSEGADIWEERGCIKEVRALLREEEEEQ